MKDTNNVATQLSWKGGVQKKWCNHFFEHPRYPCEGTMIILAIVVSYLVAFQVLPHTKMLFEEAETKANE
jgi:hypothetical protein